MNPEFDEEISPVQAPSPTSYSRQWLFTRFAIIVGSLAMGGRLLWLALENEPMNPPPLSPFIAFATAVIILLYDDIADQPGASFKKNLNKKKKLPEKSDSVLFDAKYPLAETDIMMIMEKAASGVSLKELAQEYSFSEDDFYKWMTRYGGSDAALLQQLLELKEENHRLKEMYANLSLEYQILKELYDKKAH